MIMKFLDIIKNSIKQHMVIFGGIDMTLNTIINKDVMDGFQDIDNDTVDLCVTSPPYNLGMDYGTGIEQDTIPWKLYYEWCFKWMYQVYRVMKPNRRFCLNHYLSCGEGGTNVNRGRQAPLMELNHIANDIGFKHHGVAVWTDATVSRLTAWGSYMMASAPYINSPYEGILILYKGDWKREDKGKSTISKEDFIEGASGCWNMKPEQRKGHPAPFPIKLPKLCIDLFTYEGDIVLDPFMGTGTTGVAAKQTKRHYIGIEQNGDYCKFAENRIANSLIISPLGGL
jgi:site-specific DNA-methyltransferase (adenine-specific)